MAQLKQSAAASRQAVVLPSHLQLPNGHAVPLTVRRTKGKQLRLGVRRGHVILGLPGKGHLSPAQAKLVLKFMEQNREWVFQQWQKQGGEGTAIRNGEDASVALRGNAVPLVWKQGAVARAQVVGDDDEVHVWLPASAAEGVGRSVVAQLLEAELRKDIAFFLNRWLPTIEGGAISRLSLRLTDGQWGSMNRAKRLAVCASLVGARPSALEYVIVHELCHQLHMDHSPEFWREVSARFPSHQAETDYLNRVGHKLKTMWNRLEG